MGDYSLQVGILPLTFRIPGILPKMVIDLRSQNSSRRIRNWEGENVRLTRYRQPFQYLHLLLTAAFILSIISGVWSDPTSSNVEIAYKLRRAADILFIVGVVAIFAIAVYLGSLSQSRQQRYDLILLQVYVVMPILFVRIIYATVLSFQQSPADPGHNVWVYLALLLIPDFIAVTIYTICGLIIVPGGKKVPMPSDAGEIDPRIPSGAAAGLKEDHTQVQGQSDSGQGRRYGRRRRRGGPLRMLFYALSNKS